MLLKYLDTVYVLYRYNRLTRFCWNAMGAGIMLGLLSRCFWPSQTGKDIVMVATSAFLVGFVGGLFQLCLTLLTDEREEGCMFLALLNRVPRRYHYLLLALRSCRSIGLTWLLILIYILLFPPMAVIGIAPIFAPTVILPPWASGLAVLFCFFGAGGLLETTVKAADRVYTGILWTIHPDVKEQR